MSALHVSNLGANNINYIKRRIYIETSEDQRKDQKCGKTNEG